VSLSAFLDWLGALPLWALYSSIGVVTAIENVIPPFPADAVVAFASALTARGHGGVTAAALSACVGSLAGAMFTYGLGRKYGADRMERRLMGASAERADRKFHAIYGRYGLYALFLGRFLPGVRALVPPFAGALRVPVPVAAALIGTASVVWYGAVCYLGFTIGADWAEITTAVSRHGWIAALVVVVAIALGMVVWRRRRRRP